MVRRQPVRDAQAQFVESPALNAREKVPLYADGAGATVCGRRSRLAARGKLHFGQNSPSLVREVTTPFPLDLHRGTVGSSQVGSFTREIRSKAG